jgi:signal transduction histidine kinase
MQGSVDTYLSLPRRRYFSALDLHAVGVGTVAAVVLLIGYGFAFEPMQTVIPGFPPMRPGTAFAFMLLSLALLASLRASREAKLLSTGLALASILWVSNLVLSNWGMEEGSEAMGGPIQASLAALLLGGVAILLINHAPRLRMLVAVMALLAATPALYRVLGLLFFWGAPPQKDSLLSSMAIHTAILIVWFMSVCIMLHPALGIGAAIQQASLRGRLLRRALPFIVLVPVLAAVSGLVLSMNSQWSLDFLFALDATVGAALGAGLVLWLSQIVASWQLEANERSARLSRVNEALEQYASSAAHDLKAPARHVLLYGELLDEALDRADMAQAQKYAHAIRESAQEMPRIIEGMLEFSTSAHTRIKPADVSLSELVQGAAAQLAGDIEKAGGKIAVLHEIRMRCDPALMTTVLQNLIANSLASRRRDRPLQIRIDGVAEEARWVVSVEDNGAGFDPAFAAIAFNPLARGPKPTGEPAGIGLATCRTIIQAHGGEIRIDAGMTRGARIEIILPRQGAKAE